MTQISSGALRARFRREGTDADRLGPDPMEAFRAWHADWTATAPFDPMLMTLATVDASGSPSLRAMDITGTDHGFVFMTHRKSRKAQSPRGAICFAWPEIGRQIRAIGIVETLPEAEADAAFQHLPASIRAVVQVTRQSEVLPDRATLDRMMAAAPDPSHRPASWQGYRLPPLTVEFWQQRPADVQDRILFTRDAAGGPWQTARLSP